MMILTKEERELLRRYNSCNECNNLVWNCKCKKEIVEEKKTFEEVLVSALHDLQRGKTDIDEILGLFNKALKEFIDSFELGHNKEMVEQKAKEIFGERLVSE